jgi:hypothetical protein
LKIIKQNKPKGEKKATERHTKLKLPLFLPLEVRKLPKPPHMGENMYQLAEFANAMRYSWHLSASNVISIKKVNSKSSKESATID